MSFLGMNAAQRRYNGRVIVAALAYAVLLIGEQYTLRHGHVSAAGGYALAVLPSLPIIAIFVLVGRYLIEEQDEYVRMLRVREMLWAMGFTMSCATIWGFLDNFGLVGHVDGYWIVVLWYFGQALGALVNKLTLGASTC